MIYNVRKMNMRLWLTISKLAIKNKKSHDVIYRIYIYACVFTRLHICVCVSSVILNLFQLSHSSCTYQYTYLRGDMEIDLYAFALY